MRYNPTGEYIGSNSVVCFTVGPLIGAPHGLQPNWPIASDQRRMIMSWHASFWETNRSAAKGSPTSLPGTHRSAVIGSPLAQSIITDYSG